MVTVNDSTLEFRFPGVHDSAVLRVDFWRTLRVPDDGKKYPLPAGIEEFPIFHVEDYKDTLPESWLRRGGIFIPMYQAEALWIQFSSSYPFAVKIAAGKVNAVTGGSWNESLTEEPQDYIVCPGQPWLDGFCVAKGIVRQFVAAPLGGGETVEERLTGRADFGGMQILARPMQAELYEKWLAQRERSEIRYCRRENASKGMGLAAGGLIEQEVYRDKIGIDAWDMTVRERCFVSIVNSEEFECITGAIPPPTPITKDYYDRRGIPWYTYYDKELAALDGSPALAGVNPLPVSVETADVGIVRRLVTGFFQAVKTRYFWGRNGHVAHRDVIRYRKW